MLRVRTADELDKTGYLWLKRQFVLVNDRHPVKVKVVSESYWFLFLTWFTAMGTICHVIYGTLVFSSLLFISVRDSLLVIARYMVSVICCRVILMYELASLRRVFHYSTIESSEVELCADFQTKSGASDVVTNIRTDMSSGQAFTE